MEIKIISVGKTKENYIQSGLDDYLERLQHYCDIKMIEIEPEKIRGKPTGAQIEQIKKNEGKRILDKIPEQDYIIALSVQGKPMTSEGLAKSIKNLRIQGRREISFVIGGSQGLSREIMEKSDYTLSLSHMTFTHQMIRLILVEQIYRAFKIINGEPYHK